MKNTVVIFNAGIGALTLGFQNAGYEILKAYEPEILSQFRTVMSGLLI